MSKTNTNQNQQQNQHPDCEFSYSGKFAALMLILGFALTTPVSADNLTEAMRSSTVPVVCMVSPTSLGAGTGFLVADGRHVVTNRHVVACTDEGGKVGIMAAHGELLQAAVLWQSAAKDLAILRVEKNLGGQVVTFATRSTMDERDPKMDICIGGDDAISRENHAIISFNPKKNSYLLTPGEGRGIIYLNPNFPLAPMSNGSH